jgi:hypothetical protein
MDSSCYCSINWKDTATHATVLAAAVAAAAVATPSAVDVSAVVVASAGVDEVARSGPKTVQRSRASVVQLVNGVCGRAN